MLERCQLEPLRPDQVQRIRCSQAAPGKVGRMPGYSAHNPHRDAPGAADRTTTADKRPEQQRTTRRRPGLFLLPRLHACRLPGLPDQQPGTRWVLSPLLR